MTVAPDSRRPPVLAVVGRSGSGKTTLLCSLLPRLRAAGLRIGAVKHSHHELDVDRPGKDSFRLRKAGAEQTLLISKGGWALMSDEVEPPTDYPAALDRFAGDLDLVLVEGFRGSDLPKLELIRLPGNEPPLYTQDSTVIAVITDGPLPVPTEVPCLPLGDVASIADFIIEFCKQHTRDAGRPSITDRPTGRG